MSMISSKLTSVSSLKLPLGLFVYLFIHSFLTCWVFVVVRGLLIVVASLVVERGR